MAAYSRLLIAVDLSSEAETVLSRALMLAGDAARLTLLHVVEPIIADPGYDFLPAVPQELQDDLVENARRFLAGLAQRCPVPVRQQIELGAVKAEILRCARESQADLIVVGTHGRHGVALLLGSTANSILHGTPCDVLAVRVGSAPAA